MWIAAEERNHIRKGSSADEYRTGGKEENYRVDKRCGVKEMEGKSVKRTHVKKINE